MNQEIKRIPDVYVTEDIGIMYMFKGKKERKLSGG